MSSKQRAVLKGMANSMDTILQIGKSGFTENLLRQAGDAIRARELIKLRVLETSPFSSREAADQLADKLDADVVQVIGTRFILYKRNDEKPVIKI